MELELVVFLFFLSSGGWGKITLNPFPTPFFFLLLTPSVLSPCRECGPNRVKLITLPRIYIHV